MKITSLNPLILSPNAEPIIQLFEEMGFEKKHEIDNILNKDITNIHLQDANGNGLDIAQSAVPPQDKVIIRINVDDFEEAYAMLIAHGFKNSKGDQVVELESSKSAMMISPSGFAFDLCQHLKH